MLVSANRSQAAVPLQWRWLMLDLSGYEIRGLLGAGGMGEVHCAYDKRQGQEVAIKRLPQIFTTDRELVRRCATTCAGLAVMTP